jgi:hypothetical protein
MTDEQQNVLESAPKKRSTPGDFKKGFDERRWLKGRPRVPKDTKRLFDHLLWEVLSEEIENKNTHEKVDRLRAMLRSMTTGQMAGRIEILNRILGKVPQALELGGKDGDAIVLKVVYDDRVPDKPTPTPPETS